MTHDTTEIRELREDDRIEVTLADGTELIARLQKGPVTEPPFTRVEQIEGWDSRLRITALHVEDADGTGYETLDLLSKKYDGEWGDVYGKAWEYDESAGGYVDDDIEIEDVGVLS